MRLPEKLSAAEQSLLARIKAGAVVRFRLRTPDYQGPVYAYIEGEKGRVTGALEHLRQRGLVKFDAATGAFRLKGG